MKILYLVNHLNTGGITSYVLSLAKGLKKMGHNIYLASSGGELFFEFRQAGASFIQIPIKTKSEISLKILLSLRKLSPVIKNEGIDIVHSNSRTTQVLAYLLCKGSGARHVHTCHGFFKKRLFRLLFPCWGSKIIAISESVKEHLVTDFKAREEDIAVINNGIDLDRFKKEAGKDKIFFKKMLGLNDAPVVGIIARLSDVKGHTYLIQAMKPVIEKFSRVQLLIVGEGRMEKKLVEESRRLGIYGSTVFIPSIKDVRDALQAIDIFVMPSLNEGLGLALMEAMASGLSVIGSDVGGIKSLIKDQGNGLLVPVADTKKLSLAIMELLQDNALASRLGAKARIFIKENFSEEQMLLATEKSYLECLRKAR